MIDHGRARPPEFDDLTDSQARRIDQVCDGFETVWKSGRRPRIETFLEGCHGAANGYCRRKNIRRLRDANRALSRAGAALTGSSDGQLDEKRPTLIHAPERLSVGGTATIRQVGSVNATPLITSNPHGDRNPSHICDLGVMRSASQGVSPATARLWKSVVLDPNEVGRPLIAGQPTPRSMTS